MAQRQQMFGRHAAAGHVVAGHGAMRAEMAADQHHGHAAPGDFVQEPGIVAARIGEDQPLDPAIQRHLA